MAQIKIKRILKDGIKRLKEMPFEPEVAKPKKYITLNRLTPEVKAYSIPVFRQKDFANVKRSKDVVKRLRTINLAESTKPTKTYAKLVRAVNKPKAAALETLAQTTGLPSIEKKAKAARKLTTRSGSSQEAVRKAGTLVSSTKKTKRLIEKSIMDPGKMAVRATEEGIRRPIFSTGFVLGKAQLTSPNPVVQAFPTTAVAGGLEAGARQVLPIYDRLTTAGANKFHGSKLSNLMERGINLGAKGIQVGIA